MKLQSAQKKNKKLAIIKLNNDTLRQIVGGSNSGTGSGPKNEASPGASLSPVYYYGEGDSTGEAPYLS